MTARAMSALAGGAGATMLSDERRAEISPEAQEAGWDRLRDLRHSRNRRDARLPFHADAEAERDGDEAEAARIAAIPRATLNCTKRRICPDVTSTHWAHQRLEAADETIRKIRQELAYGRSAGVAEDAVLGGIVAIICHSAAYSEEVA